MKNFFFTIIFLFTACFIGQAQKTKDTTDEKLDALTQQNQYLDELVNNWYVKQSLTENDHTSVNTFTDKTPKIIPDSVYIKRLYKLPTVVPMTYNKVVKQWIQFYTKNTASRRYLLGISQYYMPIIEQILDKYNLPLELGYLPIIESALNPRARSHSGAVGLWQFMYPTGKMYGLEINSYVDERMDVLKSTEAAAKYLRDMYKIFGNWTLSIAAYNSGAGNVKKAIKRSGGKTNFWDIYPYLPRETRGYIPAYIAALYSMNYYKEHNIIPKKIDMDMLTDTVMIKKKLNLKQVAEYLKIDFDKLATLNPQYKRNIIPGNVKPYPLRLPFDKVSDFLNSENEIYKYKDSIYLNDQVSLISPAKSNRPYNNYNYSPPSTKHRKKLYYTVKSDDTYSNIAEWYDCSVNDLKYWNKTRSTRLQIGQKIAVWIPAKKYAHYQKINKMTIEQKTNTNIPTIHKKPVVKPDKNKYVVYKIKSGDNLWTVAKKFDGISANDIQKINGFSDEDVRDLKIGQEIIVKKK
ncbi:MAG: transglycosylase SLT domain-containing protein [Chlorobi bacterium]|nr:transglycosylase SLT domain-containing protein [Chlorobiota bacterium]